METTADVAPVVTESAPTPDASPVDTSGGAPVAADTSVGQGTTPAVEEKAPESGKGTEPSGEWSGELDSLDKQDWYSSIPESGREAVKSGLSRILKGWQAAFTKKSQALADERKTLQAENVAEKERIEEWTRNERSKLHRIMYGDEDPVASAQKAWELEKKELTEGLTKTEAEWKAKYDALKGEYEAPLNELKQKHSALEAEHTTYKTRVESERAENQKRVFSSIIENFKVKPDAYAEQPGFFPGLLEKYEMDADTSALYTEALMDFVKKEAPDLASDDKLWESLWKRITDHEYSIREAIEYTRERAGKTKPASPAERAMSNGGPGPAQIVSRSNDGEDALAYLSRHGVA